MMKSELTPEERRAVDDYLSLSRPERESLMEFVQFANRPHRDDPSITNLHALIDLVRKRPALVDVMKRAEWMDHARRLVIMLGGLSGAIVAILAAAKAISERMAG